MAPKRYVPLDEPPSASSDDETDNLISGQENDDPSEEGDQEIKKKDSESESESEEEEKTPPKKKPFLQNPKQTTTTQKPQSEEEEEESDSDTESDMGNPKRSPTASDFTVKPVKPMDNPTKPKKPLVKPSIKRCSETEKDGKDSMRKKVKVSNGDVEEKKGGNIRLWSEDDELVILQGIFDYESEKGSDPFADMGAFLDFIKGSLHVNVSKSQLSDKARRLKKRFQNSVGKDENGEDPVFSRPHEYKLFQLSKKIWGSGDSCNGVNDSVNNNKIDKNQAKKSEKSLGKPKEEAKKEIVLSEVVKDEEGKPKEEAKKEIVLSEVVKDEDEDEMRIVKGDFKSMYPNWNAALEQEVYPLLSVPTGGRILVKESLGLIGDKAKEFNDAWKAIHVEEMELHAKKVELLQILTQVVVDALKR